MRCSYLRIVAAAVILGWSLPTHTLRAEELTVDNAIEGLADEDAATRKKAEEFLKAQGDKAIPALQKALDSKDPEIRKAVAALLTIAKRGPITIQILDQQGKPVAATEFQVMVFKSEEGAKVYAYADQVYMDNAKSVLDFTRKTDAAGKLVTDELNQDNYAVVLKSGGELPAQAVKLDATVKEDAKPVEWKIFLGAELTLKIVDENDKPLPDAVALFPEGYGDYSLPAIHSYPERKLIKRLENYAKDTCAKAGADGAVAFKKLFNNSTSLLIFHPGYARVEKTGVKVNDGQSTDLGTIKLVPVKNSTVKVTLVDKDKKPLKGLTVIIVDSDQRQTLKGYVDANQLPKVLDWKYAHSAGPSDDNGVASASLPPGEYAFAAAHGTSTSLVWIDTVENGTDLDCGTVVLP